MFRKLLDAQSKSLVVDYKVLALDETVPLQRVEQSDIPWRVSC